MAEVHVPYESQIEPLAHDKTSVARFIIITKEEEKQGRSCTILCNEIVVTEGEDKILVLLIPAVKIHWTQGETLPFLVQKSLVLITAIVNTETVQLTVDIEV